MTEPTPEQIETAIAIVYDIDADWFWGGKFPDHAESRQNGAVYNIAKALAAEAARVRAECEPAAEAKVNGLECQLAEADQVIGCFMGSNELLKMSIVKRALDRHAARGQEGGVTIMKRTLDDLPQARSKLFNAKITALRNALRRRVMGDIHPGSAPNPTHRYCAECNSRWPINDPEQHEPGCLAELPGEDN